MKKAIFTLGLMLAFSVATSAQSQTEPDLWIYEYKEVIDTAKADSIVAAYNAEYNATARIEALRAFAAPIEEEIAEIDKLMSYEESGKKLETELYKNSTFFVLVRLCKGNPNVTDKELKTVNKGKVPKGFTEKVLLPAKSELQSRIDSFEYTPVKYHSWGTVFKQYYYDREAGREMPSKFSSNEDKLDRPMKTITIRKPNLECADNYFNGTFRLSDYKPWSEYESHHWDKIQQSQGWEWSDGMELQSKTVYFPEERSYKYHPSHPEYRISCNWRDNYCYHPNVYDEKGMLVRAGNIDGLGQGYEKIAEAVMTAICKRDFLANKYDINSAKPETLLALRIKFDLADAVDARFKKYMKMAQDARDEKLSATTPAQYAAAQKKQNEALNVLMEYVAKECEPQAMNYIKQLKSDHQAELSYLYKIERVDNVTFKLYFLNDKMGCGCIAQMKWSNKEPYEAQYEIELLPCETITIRR
ncbi:MAG: hypothetical protein J6I49_06810 [Bacteroidales bacterium]|nr:hypothetical protein [Bacteroidales bacterium]